MEFSVLGRWLMVAGVALVLVGLVITLAGKIPFLGRLPGDILIKRDHFTFYFPLATCIVLSIVLSVLFRLFGRK